MLRVEDVTVRYDGHAALDDASLDVAAGETLTVLGPSGSGKTTLLRVVAGLQIPDEGRVLLDGQDLATRAAAPPRHRARIPGSRALPAPRRCRATSASASGCAATMPTPWQTRRRAPRARRPRRVRAPLRRNPLGRRAAAGRARARARARAAPAPARRAARVARPAASRPAPRRPRAPLRRARPDRRLRHARPDRGVRARRPRRGHARRVASSQVATPDELWAHPADEDVARFLGIGERRRRRDRPARGGDGTSGSGGEATAASSRRFAPGRRCASAHPARRRTARSMRSSSRSSIRARATGSTSRSTRRASFASRDPPPRRRPRSRPGRVLPRHGAPPCHDRGRRGLGAKHARRHRGGRLRGRGRARRAPDRHCVARARAAPGSIVSRWSRSRPKGSRASRSARRPLPALPASARQRSALHALSPKGSSRTVN